MTIGSMLKARLRNLGLVVMGLALGIGIAEIALRIVWQSKPVFDDFDPARGVRLRPGAEGWYTNEGKAYIKINSMGYRDIERSKSKPASVFRIAVLGDSFTEARQVDVPSTFWKLLESKLGGAAALAGRKVEVMNFGIGGHGTSQELITLEQDVLAFSPDLVLLAYFNGNDLINNSAKLSHRIMGDWMRPFHRLDNGKLVLDNSFQNQKWRIARARLTFFMVHHFRLAELANQVRIGFMVRNIQREQARAAAAGPATVEQDKYSAGTDFATIAPPQIPEVHEAWEVTEALIVEMNRVTTNAGGRFVLVVLGHPAQADLDVQRRARLARSMGLDDLLYAERRLLALGEKAKFPVLALQPRMQQTADRNAVHLHGFANTAMGTGHWNENGHRLAAELIAGDLIAQGLLMPR